ncbi:glycosyltransferase [Shimia thalassica]|uniref:glycosyltransferase n=1 Tax=Shimia thalassica TaxID=1715693 RepID=UPI001C0A2C2D|nr:glycosyltransferase [Shimia thalassica]MBU2941213.1 glycosyltransferase [Shimia thalassica]MDO6503303.1 glycosyltransferase [Shimia thalassica]
MNVFNAQNAPRATVLIPAYNEASVIKATLAKVCADMHPGEFEIIVIANACHDDTADVASAACPAATVLSTSTPGKTNALRLGLAQANSSIFVFLDADLLVDTDTLRALIAPLENGTAMASFGRMNIDLTGCSAFVKSFYAAWSQSPYMQNGKFGGLFAMTQKGLDRALPLPDLIADDEYFSRHFSASEKTLVNNVSFTAHPPRSLSDLFKVRKRVRRGTQQLKQMNILPRQDGVQSPAPSALKSLVLTPTKWTALMTYVGLSLSVRAALAFEKPVSGFKWERDDSSRSFIQQKEF